MNQDAKRPNPPYVPSPEEIEAIAKCAAALEGLSVQSRGHVLARLGDMYHLQRVKNAGKKSKAVVPAKPKEPWKVQWETTPEYRAWKARTVPPAQAALQSDEEKAQFASLQAAAFAVRAEIKGRFQVVGGSQPPAPERTGARNQVATPAPEAPQETKSL